MWCDIVLFYIVFANLANSAVGATSGADEATIGADGATFGADERFQKLKHVICNHKTSLPSSSLPPPSLDFGRQPFTPEQPFTLNLHLEQPNFRI